MPLDWLVKPPQLIKGMIKDIACINDTRFHGSVLTNLSRQRSCIDSCDPWNILRFKNSSNVSCFRQLLARRACSFTTTPLQVGEIDS